MDDFPPSPPADFIWTAYERPLSWAYSSAASSTSAEPSPRWTSGSSSSASSVSSSMPPPAPLCLPKATLDDIACPAPLLPFSEGDVSESDSQATYDSYPTTDTGSSTPSGTSCALLPSDYVIGSDGLPLIPPENFALVAPGVYRSAFPAAKSFPFLKTLGLKTVVTLVADDYPAPNAEFVAKEGLKFYQFGIPGHKEPIGDIPDEKILAALALIFDRRNHPILVHCNKGKHRTGCLVGCLRKAQKWAKEDISSEYLRHSYPKSRVVDQDYIDKFHRLDEVWANADPRYLPTWLASCSPLTSRNKPVSAAPEDVAPSASDSS